MAEALTLLTRIRKVFVSHISGGHLLCRLSPVPPENADREIFIRSRPLPSTYLLLIIHYHPVIRRHVA